MFQVEFWNSHKLKTNLYDYSVFHQKTIKFPRASSLYYIIGRSYWFLFFTQSSHISSSQVAIFVYSEDMKISKIVLALIFTLSILPSFGQANADKEKELFEFSVTDPIDATKITTTVEAKTTTEKVIPVETKTALKVEVKTESKSVPVPAALVADAETLIKDKLVQKYQVRLDDVISRMTNRMSTASAVEQRVALTDLRDRMTEKKWVVTGMKGLEPLKQDIITAILDHVIFRLDGIIKQSAQTQSDKFQA